MRRLAEDLAAARRRFALKPVAETVLPKAPHGGLARTRLANTLREMLIKAWDSRF